MKIPLYEHFSAFQGEGAHQGRAAYFLRTYACDVHCIWCDSAGTWHPDYRPEHLEYLTPKELAMVPLGNARGSNNFSFVVITGGEPTLYDLTETVDALHSYGFMVHLETAGHREIRGDFDWVTLSPKPFGLPPLRSNIARADEIKIIVDSDVAVQEALTLIRPEVERSGADIWLHPEWGSRNDPAVIDSILEWVMRGPPFRAGLQMHKFYMVDERDPNSVKAPIPLGGEEARGAATR